MEDRREQAMTQIQPEVGPVHLTANDQTLCGEESEQTMPAKDFTMGMPASIATTVCHDCIEAFKHDPMPELRDAEDMGK
jgi:hypothetical protein